MQGARTLHALGCKEETSSSVGVLCLIQEHIAVCGFVLLLNGFENIFDNVGLEFKFIVFSGNHDNHAWSDLPIVSINWIWLR